MKAILYAIISCLGYGATHVFNKKLMGFIKNPFQGVLYSNFFLVLSTLIAVTFADAFQWPTPKMWIIIFINGIVGMIALVALFEGLKREKVAIVLSVANSFPVVTLVLSIIFLDLTTKLTTYIGIIIIIIGMGFLMLRKLSDFSFNKDFVYGLITALGWGAFSFLIKVVENEGLNPWMTIFMFELFILIALILYIAIFQRRITKPTKNILLYALFGGIFLAIGAMFYSLALSFAHPALISSIVSANPVVAAIIAFIFLKEKLCFKRSVGIGLVVVGVIVLSL